MVFPRFIILSKPLKEVNLLASTINIYIFYNCLNPRWVTLQTQKQKCYILLSSFILKEKKHHTWIIFLSNHIKIHHSLITKPKNPVTTKFPTKPKIIFYKSFFSSHIVSPLRNHFWNIYKKKKNQILHVFHSNDGPLTPKRVILTKYHLYNFYSLSLSNKIFIINKCRFDILIKDLINGLIEILC